MNRYYTTHEGAVIVWNPDSVPALYNHHERLMGQTSVLEMFFRNDNETMVYVPWDVVRILTEGF